MEKKTTKTKTTCYQCKRPISKIRNTYILVGTYNRRLGREKLPDHEAYFHFKCFINYHEGRITERAEWKIRDIINDLLEVVEEKAIRHIKERLYPKDAKPKKRTKKRASKRSKKN